jgi:tetratricopeptide (TPR) repeat protein
MRTIMQIVRKLWKGLLTSGLAFLISLSNTGLVWAGVTPQGKEPTFQGIPLQCFVSLAESGDAPDAKVAAYTEIASKYAELDRPEQAKQILEKGVATAQAIASPNIEAFALLDLAGRLTKLKQEPLAIATLDEAFPISTKLEDPVDQVFALIKFAQSYGEAGNREKANRILENAIQETAKLIDPYVRSRAFAAIANSYTAIGNDFQSESAISAATDVLAMIDDPNIRTRARVEIAGSYAQAGNHSKSAATLATAFAEFERMRDQDIASLKADTQNMAKAKTLNKVSSANTKTSANNKLSPAKDSEALQAKEKLAIANAESLKTRSLFLVASQYIASEQYEKALEVIANVDKMSIEKRVGIANVAIAYAKNADQRDRALALFEQTLDGLEQVPPSIDVFTLLLEVGRQYANIQAPELAIQTWQQALTVAQNLNQPAQRLFALTNLASVYGELTDQPQLTDQVPAILETSLAIAKTAPDPNIRSRAFSDISSTYWAIGQNEQAQKLAQDIENPTEKEQLLKLFSCASAK